MKVSDEIMRSHANIEWTIMTQHSQSSAQQSLRGSEASPAGGVNRCLDSLI